MKSKVYFSHTITPEKVLDMYRKLGKELTGKVAVKVHSGEPGNQNFLTPEFWKPVVDYVGGTITECNTAYNGQRNTTERHMATFKKHGWSDCYQVDLLDAAGPDLVLPVPNGKVIKENYVGKDLANYDSLLVLSHFKGHPMGGYGGALKQLSIGIASAYGKAYIHGAVVDYFKGNAVYVNVMKNMSVDCDCCAVAEDPCMADMGILVSLDPVAIDQAGLDLIYASDDPGRDHMVERIESRNGKLTIEAAAELGVGSQDYELIVLD